MKRCPNGTRRHKSRCMKHTTVKKRCPNGTRRCKSRCVKKVQSRSNKRGGGKSTKYIITVHDSNGKQIKDMDYSMDDPLEFIEQVEKKIKVENIVPMNDKYIPNYKKLNRIETSDVDDNELASIWFCETDKKMENNYNINHEGKNYIVKFHDI